MTTTGKIDVHFHVFPEFWKEAVYAAGLVPSVGTYPASSPSLALEAMDRHGIDVAVTSPATPGVHFGSAAYSAALARKYNESSAQLMASAPRRFGAFAMLPMQDTELALAEVEYSLDQLKLNGIGLFSSYADRFLGDPVFDPVFELLNEQAAVVALHPSHHPSSKNLKLAMPPAAVEYLFDTTRAAVNMLFADVDKRFPRIRFILPHAGGTLPFCAWRLAVLPLIDRRLPPWSKEEFLKRTRYFWFDTALSAGPASMAALMSIADPSRVLFGSDWPFTKDGVFAEMAKDGEVCAKNRVDLDRVDRANALALFPQWC